MRHTLVLLSTKNNDDDAVELPQLGLEPEEVIFIYHQFYILDTLTFHSDSILATIHDRYYEEFKLVFANYLHFQSPLLTTNRLVNP